MVYKDDYIIALWPCSSAACSHLSYIPENQRFTSAFKNHDSQGMSAIAPIELKSSQYGNVRSKVSFLKLQKAVRQDSVLFGSKESIHSIYRESRLTEKATNTK